MGILRRSGAAIFLIVLLAFALRLWEINVRSLWFDEAVEYWSAAAPLGALSQTVLTAFQPPLFTFVLHTWLAFGMTAIWLRFLSVILSIFTLLGVMIWAYRLLGARGALIAGSIMAILPAEIRYAQEISEYALMVCVLTWSLVFLNCPVTTQQWRDWILWGLFCVASIYTHYGTALIIIPLTAVSLVESVWRHQQQAIRQEMTVSMAGLLTSIPLMRYFFLKQANDITKWGSAPFISLSGEIARFVHGTGDTFQFLLGFQPDLGAPTGIVQFTAFLLLILCLIVLLHPLSKGVSRGPVTWLFVAFGVYFIVVRLNIYTSGYFGGRYALILEPLFVVAVAAAIEQVIRRRLAAVAMLLLFLIVAIGSISLPDRHLEQYTSRTEVAEKMQEVVAYWQEHRKLDEPVYVYYGAVPAFRYYLRLNGIDTGPLPAIWYEDCWEGKSIPACSDQNIFYGAWFRNFPRDKKIESIYQSLGSRPQRFWINFSHIDGQDDRDLLQDLFPQYTLGSSFQMDNAAAYLLEKY
ncbi:MAG: glycosyltransferase family 39 protein [Chloroflexi bacterium]|nr:glycosyltransferase family 39 protein [Chloroflexota bacterium]